MSDLISDGVYNFTSTGLDSSIPSHIMDEMDLNKPIQEELIQSELTELMRSRNLSEFVSEEPVIVVKSSGELEDTTISCKKSDEQIECRVTEMVSSDYSSYYDVSVSHDTLNPYGRAFYDALDSEQSSLVNTSIPYSGVALFDSNGTHTKVAFELVEENKSSGIKDSKAAAEAEILNVLNVVMTQGAQTALTPNGVSAVEKSYIYFANCNLKKDELLECTVKQSSVDGSDGITHKTDMWSYKIDITPNAQNETARRFYNEAVSK